MKISIIVPVFNAEMYIERCIESVLKQTYTDFELLLVNDGSTDNSRNICDAYAQKDKRIRVITKNNEGPSAARNSALKIATGEYIGFIDSDDWIDKDMYNILVKSAQENDSDVVCSGYKYVVDSGIINTISMCAKLENYSLTTNGVPVYEMFIRSKRGIFNVWNKLYKRDIIKNNNIFFPNDKMSAEDCEFNLKIVKYASKYTFIPEALYNYYLSNNSLTRGYIKDCFQKHLDWRYMIEKYLPHEVIKNKENQMAMNKTTIHDTIYSLNQEIWYKPKTDLSYMFNIVMLQDDIKEIFDKSSLFDVENNIDKIFFLLLKKRNLFLYKKFAIIINYLKKIKSFIKAIK